MSALLGVVKKGTAMTEDADEWTERLLVATADDIDEWTEKLLVELKRVSTKNLAGERDAFVAMPSAIERAISELGPLVVRSEQRGR